MSKSDTAYIPIKYRIKDIKNCPHCDSENIEYINGFFICWDCNEFFSNENGQ